jgi:pseudaminic acid synthase
MKPIKIGTQAIGDGYPCFVIAEISANHNQDFNLAKRLVKLAKESGADAVKFQTYTPETMTLDCDNDYFRIKEGPWKGQTLYELYKKAYTPWKWFKGLKEFADEIGITFISTPFDKTAVDLLETIDVPAYKIASFELNDIPLISYIASKGKPVILSTGMGSLADIELAVNTIREKGNEKIILLKCTSDYPADPKDMNLVSMQSLSQTFGVMCGLSDHSLFNEVSLAAVCWGAKIIEKHFTDDEKRPGPDSAFSISSAKLSELIKSIHVVENAKGKSSYSGDNGERKNYIFRRSLFVVKDIDKGERFTELNVRSIRPHFGLEPKHYMSILNKKSLCKIKAGTPLTWSMVELDLPQK